MRKPLEDMTPEERRAEAEFQEEHFRHLTSHLEPPKPLPKTWYGRWWRKWGEIVDTTVRIFVGSFLYIAIASIIIAALRVLLGAA